MSGLYITIYIKVYKSIQNLFWRGDSLQLNAEADMIGNAGL